MSDRFDGPDGPGDADAPLSAEDEAHVHDLLAALPDPEVPDDVRARIAAALDAPDPAASTTVLATPRPPSGSWRNPRLLQVAAAVVIFALVGATAWGLVVANSDDGSRPGTVAGAGAEGGSTAITASGTAYTQANLGREVNGLLTGGTSSAEKSQDRALSSAAEPDSAAAGALDTASTTGITSLMENPEARQRCLDELSGVPGQQALAIDVATFNAKPAAVIVLPNADDPAALDVWVVGPTCSDADNPFPYQYQPIPRP